jgi:hypothetical protein
MEPLWGRSDVGRKFRSLTMQGITWERKCKRGDANKTNLGEIWRQGEKWTELAVDMLCCLHKKNYNIS